MTPHTLQEHNDGCKHRNEPGPHQQQPPGHNARFVIVRGQEKGQKMIDRWLHESVITERYGGGKHN